MTSLFVGNLHDDVTREILHDNFIRFGTLCNIRVICDRLTNQSRGYGYVDFQHPANASTAFHQMDGEEIMGCRIRILWSDDYKFVRRYQEANVVISNLHPDIDEGNLWKTFYDFMLLSCKVDRDSKGNSKGLAYVQFKEEKFARYFIEKIDGKLLNDQEVRVNIFHTLSHRQRHQDDTFTNIFVKNFRDKLDEAKLKVMFEFYGTVKSVAIMKDGKNISKGYGFVAMENHTTAQKAVDEMNNLELAGTGKLYVARAQKRRERSVTLRKEFEKKVQSFQGRNVFVKNLPETVNDDQLREEFNRFGTVISAKVMRDGSISKRFGFVCFSTREEAGKAVAEMNGNYIDWKQIHVSFAQRRDERKAVLRSLFRNKTQTEMTQKNQVTNQQVIAPVYTIAEPGVARIPLQLAPSRSPSQEVYPSAQYVQVPNAGNQVIRPTTTVQPQQISGLPTNQFISSPYVPTSLSEQEQKTELGRRLYPLVVIQQPNLASTITDMILEYNTSQIFTILENPNLLAFTVQKAVELLQQRN